jgi:hypothetical protein
MLRCVEEAISPAFEIVAGVDHLGDWGGSTVASREAIGGASAGSLSAGLSSSRLDYDAGQGRAAMPSADSRHRGVGRSVADHLIEPLLTSPGKQH